MANLFDVAKMANVSVATASNALNNKALVKPETRRRVLEVARQLNYIPNTAARSLVTRSSRNIGVVVSGASSNVFSNPVVIEIIKAINMSLNERGYTTSLNIITKEREVDIPLIAQNGTTDALIFIGSRSTDQELESLSERISIPFLVFNRKLISNAYTVTMDHKKNGYIATKYLIDMGHKRIGYIGRVPGMKRTEERVEGYCQALEEAGIPFDENLIVNEDFFQESGYIGARKLLNQTSIKPSAIVAFNDIMALGIMEAFHQEGLRIPDDISLIGCDNIPNLHLLKVPLTTVTSSFEERGKLAAKKIIGVLEGKDSLPDCIVVESELKIRSSVASLV